jgi:hypothetical protein
MWSQNYILWTMLHQCPCEEINRELNSLTTYRTKNKEKKFDASKRVLFFFFFFLAINDKLVDVLKA